MRSTTKRRKRLPIRKDPSLYCSPCRKQCRNKTGYALHLQSMTHCANDGWMDSLDHTALKFDNGFKTYLMGLLDFKTGVDATNAYNEYIKDHKDPLESTTHKTLRSFIKGFADRNLLEFVNQRKLIVKQIDAVTTVSPVAVSPATTIVNKPVSKVIHLS